MRKMFIIASAVVTDAIRQKVVWIVLVFAALLAMAIPGLPSYGVGVVSAVYREVAVALMFVAALAVGLALSTTRIPAEVERRTVFTVLARDVARWQYVCATWLGIFLVVGIVVAVYAAVAILIGALVYHEIMLILLQAALAVWLEMGVVTALAVLMSTRFGVVTNVIAALAFVFVGHSIGTVIDPGGSMSLWWIPSLQVFDVVNPVAHGGGYDLTYALSMLGAFAAWCVVLLTGASLLFSSRDL